MVVFASINLVNTLPSVSIPNDKGVTSNSNTSSTSPTNTPPWIAAPKATTSSGFTPLLLSLPKISLTVDWTIGILVDPPTKITSLISEDFNFASFNAFVHGATVFFN